ncbi:MAG: ABC transporter ATP-binding protein [Bryobacteraceae bacterium]
MTPAIQAENLSVNRGARRVLANLTFDFKGGEFIALLGLNGAGKSTLLETLSGVLGGYEGICSIASRELRTYTRRELSRVISFLPQAQLGSSGFSVRQVVAMGRFPHSAGWNESPDDRRAMDAALEACHCGHLSYRRFGALSGGERQRALLAAALAQETLILALDEPSAHADPPLQAAIFDLLRVKAATGAICVAAVHDINLAVAFATRAILLHEGSILYDGNVAAMLTSSAFEKVFGPQIVVRHDIDGQAFAAYSRRASA